ncbi:hypothetical protein BJF77_12030 [Kocuria sp. CNJ-770]|uniref:hypothetical protein n=1 Tax=Kocuria sp. CNJ-770 TaxID=1904964 RepID=UPI000964ACC7|nr:hypothetical protein [Kocuria sp. CNJ-770]OLT08687.1 hypothetical protein BJF77_12030 [Kocuria sp. CNJ-770]
MTARNSLFREIHTAAVPEYAATLRAWETLKREALAEPTGDLPRQFEQELTAALAAEALKPEPDFTALLTEHQRRMDEVKARGNAGESLLRAASLAEHHLEQIEQAVMLDAVHEIRTRVEAIGDRVRALGRIPATAEEALNTGRHEAWNTMREATTEFHALTRVYSDVTHTAANQQQRTWLLPAAFIADPMAHPWFTARRGDATRLYRSTQGSPWAQDMRQWAAGAPASRFPASYSGVTVHPDRTTVDAWLTWLIHEDLLAVHDPQDALALWDSATAATEPHDGGSAQSAVMARYTHAQQVADHDETQRIKDLIESIGPRGKAGSFAR